MKRCVLFLFLTVVLSAQSAPEVEITAEPHHHQVLANDYVRVFNVEVPAHSDTLMHWHRHDYIYVTLGTTKVVNAVKGKDPVSITLADGETRFLPATFAHIARDVDDHPFKNVTIEHLQDEKLRQSPAHWDPAHPEEDRGLEILHGGTQEILFVKDGVRVSEIELQPGGVAPMPAKAYLLVALTNLRLHHQVTNEPHMAMDDFELNSGDSKWLAGDLTTNGPTPAKFVTLEFH
jgi:hypothetical protein